MVVLSLESMMVLSTKEASNSTTSKINMKRNTLEVATRADPAILSFACTSAKQNDSLPANRTQRRTQEMQMPAPQQSECKNR